MAATWWLLGVCDGGSRVEQEREGERERERGEGGFRGRMGGGS